MPPPKDTETVGSTAEPAAVSVVAVASPPAPIKAMSAGQQTFCRHHSVLLVRNLARVRRLREHYLGQLQQQQQQQPQQQQLAGAAPRQDVPPYNRETGGSQESLRDVASSPLHRNVCKSTNTGIPVPHGMLLKIVVICVAHLFSLIWFVSSFPFSLNRVWTIFTGILYVFVAVSWIRIH
jgi:hypothetical protein